MLNSIHALLLLLLFWLFIWKAEFTEKEGESERMLIHPPQMTATARAGPGWSRELGIPIRSPLCTAGALGCRPSSSSLHRELHHPLVCTERSCYLNMCYGKLVSCGVLTGCVAPLVPIHICSCVAWTYILLVPVCVRTCTGTDTALP